VKTNVYPVEQWRRSVSTVNHGRDPHVRAVFFFNEMVKCSLLECGYFNTDTVAPGAWLGPTLLLVYTRYPVR
jgi:hypothetical protein